MTSHYENYKQAISNHKASERQLREALYNSRTYERIPIQTLADDLGVHRNTIKNMYDEIAAEKAQNPAPQLHTIDLTQLTPEQIQTIQHALTP